jgi:uncharacterized Rossmann fold enzyme
MIKNFKLYVFLSTLFLLSSFEVYAQSGKVCKIPEFNSCIGLNQLVVKNISGQVRVYLERKETNEEDFVIVSDACVSLFTKDRKLVSSTTTDEDGVFKLNKVKDGNYWMVVRDNYNALTPAVIEVKVSRKVQRNKKITVHMVILAIDSCSYGELQ